MKGLHVHLKLVPWEQLNKVIDLKNLQKQITLSKHLYKKQKKVFLNKIIYNMCLSCALLLVFSGLKWHIIASAKEYLIKYIHTYNYPVSHSCSVISMVTVFCKLSKLV